MISRSKQTMRAVGRARTSTVVTRRKAQDDEFGLAPVPRTASLRTLRQAARGCRACPLWKLGTCTVFGEGPRNAQIIFVGEQPGDVEDREGKPFIGPAGRMLDKALVDAGVDRAGCYVTNAVKHFKWVARGQRRMHETPTEREVAACRPWLEAELELIKPELVVCLGSTAALSVLHQRVKILQNRGQVIELNGRRAMLSVHPSMLLRIPDRDDRHAAYEQFVADLKRIPLHLQNAGKKR